MNIGGTIHLRPSGVIFVIICLFSLYGIYSWRSSRSNSAGTTDLCQLLCAAIQSAEAGGREVKLVREKSNAEINEKSKGKTKEGVNDPLTDGDLKSHHVMFGSLNNAFPGVKIISEEHSESSSNLPVPPVPELSCSAVESLDLKLEKNEDITVWIDPLDATKEYTENLLEYVTTMVCVAVRGKPVIGVIHKPFEEKTYWAWKDVGFSDEITRMKDEEKSNENKFVISMSHAGEVKKFIKAGFPEADIREAAGAGYKSLLVANSESAAYVHKTLIKKWDVCAGHAILSAMKGEVTTLKGTEITYDDEQDKVIKDGLLATLHNHQVYLRKLGQNL